MPKLHEPMYCYTVSIFLLLSTAQKLPCSVLVPVPIFSYFLILARSSESISSIMNRSSHKRL
jgi:hypothetical protein